MVRLFVRLKLRLLARGLRAAGGRAIFGVAIAAGFALLVGCTAGLGLLQLRDVTSDRVAGDLSAIAAAVTFVVWSIGPLVTGSEATLDPERLVLLPIPPARMMPGLLAAGAVGFGGLATLLALAGLLGGMAPSSPLIVVTMAGTVLLLATCVAASRLVGTALSAAVRQRRLRDLALFAGPLVGIALSIAFQIVPRAMTGSDGRLDEARIPDVLRYGSRLLPSGPPAVAIEAARAGDTTIAVAALLISVVTVVLLLGLWSALLERVLTTTSDSALATRRRRRSLLGGPFAALPASRFGAVVAKDLRLSWRDPRQRAALLSAFLPAIVPIIGGVASGADGPRPKLVLLAAIPVFVLGASSTNLYGYDGAAHWTDVAAGARGAVRTDLAAKATARAVVMLPAFVVTVVVLAVLGQSWTFVPLAITVAIAAAGVTLGAAVIGSVRAPLPMPDTPSNPFSTGNAGQGMAVAGAGCLTMLMTGAIVAPIGLAAAAVGDEPRFAVVVGALAVASGVVGWRVGLASATRRAVDREPELLAALEAAR